MYKYLYRILLFGNMEGEMNSMRNRSPEVREERDQLGVLKYIK